jgi:hypothetical protein
VQAGLTLVEVEGVVMVLRVGSQLIVSWEEQFEPDWDWEEV